MTWFKVDDHLHSHSKSMRAGVEAMGLWALAGSWSAAEESDGWVPGFVLPRLAGAAADALAASLVRAGLWMEDERDGEAGYQFHAWDEYQPTRESLERKRADQRERMARVRAKSVRAHTSRSEDAVTPTPTRPDPTIKNTAADTADFDAFWAEYPRKVGKTAAAKAHTKAVKGTDPATILDGLRNAVQVWKASNTEPQFIPHAATWLNAGRWADEQPMPGMPERPARPTRTAAQCSNPAPHGRHDWDQPHPTRPGVIMNAYVCLGA